ncbi:class I SAM-dependent methyltransferase [Bacillaceae bacterium S4-13-58]
MVDINQKIKKRYNRVSGIYDRMDRMIKSDWRTDLLSRVHGNVLEVGVGTGANLSYYPLGVNVTGIDFSKGMLKHALEKLKSVENKDRIKLVEMDAQALDFPDNSFDFVVTTCVFCSVPDPVKGLKELRRVCKPEGRILMLEHMRSENLILGPIMDIANPIVVNLWGANINRKTLENINKAGLQIEKNEQLMGTFMRRLVIKPNKS